MNNCLPESYTEPKACRRCDHAERVHFTPFEKYYCSKHHFYPANDGVCNDYE